jgi:hypothetical protein
VLEAVAVIAGSGTPGLTSLRPDVINALLGASVSIKVKRLLLFLADRHDYPCFSKVTWRQLDLGSGKRAITKGGVLDKQFMITVPEHYRGQS